MNLASLITPEILDEIITNSPKFRESMVRHLLNDSGFDEYIRNAVESVMQRTSPNKIARIKAIREWYAENPQYQTRFYHVYPVTFVNSFGVRHLYTTDHNSSTLGLGEAKHFIEKYFDV